MTYIYNSQLDAFTLYHIAQEDSTTSHSSISPALPALCHALSGAAGTAISKIMIYPLDLVITRLQVQKQFGTTNDSEDVDYKGILDAAEKIYDNEGGIKAFYSGLVPDTAKTVADTFLFFLAYNYFQRRRLNARESSQSLLVLNEIGVGMLAGAISKFWTTPLQNIVTRKQVASMVSARGPRTSTSKLSPELSVKNIALQIRHEKGLQGFWSGYSASLVLTLNPAITFLLHKAFLQTLVPSSRRSDPGARLTFLIAAVSKALASTVTYPFSLAKTRAQVTSQPRSELTGPTSDNEKAGEDPIVSKAVKARQRTVFSTILWIAKTEGILALYQGLGAEVLKGFFSHGLAMLMKGRIHRIIVNLYFMVLKAVKQSSSPQEMGNMAT
ncbi:mitochondrial carrier [Lepidopterella palustris CBS 459.81]|uniref:Mitochondrial carrier n=1 Tax=Lepidopterella palustris CBS 459.81 TaxID=1314670 RepID=A0A8E2E8W4_9PEZI|nr:mitochondrial carrier [Lepidopterella palustris CBS 459.81]